MFEWLRRKPNQAHAVKRSGLNEAEPSGLKAKARKAYTNQYLGPVIHYYTKLHVAIIRIERGSLTVGDIVYVQGATTRFKQKVSSIEFEHQKVKTVGPGYEVGIRVGASVRDGDDVYVMESSA